MVNEKRKRSTNFSVKETELLIDLIVNKYAKIIENKATDSATWKQKEAAWKSLSLNFNAQSDTSRNEKTLKMKYESVKKKLKKKYVVNKFKIYKTGTGEETENIYEPYETKLLLILTFNSEKLPYEVDGDKNDVGDIDAYMLASAEENDIVIEKEDSYNLADDDIEIKDENMIIADPGPSFFYHNTRAESEIDQEEVFKENIEFKASNVSENGKERNTSTWTPETLKRQVSKKFICQKPKEQIKNKLYMLADGRSELLKQQLILAEKEIYLKDLEIKIKERELENMQREHELKIKILEKQYNNL